MTDSISNPRSPRQRAAMSGYGATTNISAGATPTFGKCYNRICKEKAFIALTTGLVPATYHRFADRGSEANFIFNNQFIVTMKGYVTDPSDSGGSFLILDPIDNQMKLLGIISRGGEYQVSPGVSKYVDVIQYLTQDDIKIINSYANK